MANRPNPEALQRNRIARYFFQCLTAYGITPKEVAKDIGVHVETIKRLPRSAPQLHVLHPLGRYIQKCAKKRLKKFRKDARAAAALRKKHKGSPRKKPRLAEALPQGD